jgi:TubC N-terminal docking domain
MTAQTLLATLGRRDLSVVVEEGDSLRVTGPRSAMTPDLEQAIREHKAELVELVASDGWPPESLDAERRFGAWHARLYPFIGRTVSTPCGDGRLVQVFPERANVILPGMAQAGVFLPEELRPSRGPHAAVFRRAHRGSARCVRH